MKRTGLLATLFLLAVTLLTACATPAPDNGTSDATLTGAVATVEFVELEGGCWTLELAGERLLPLALPDEYRVDGLRVRVSLRVVEAATICQMGRAVEVESIERME